ncbi:CatB-related O-acetyltransferase [Candidatus Woesearchaeota archaeon]|nr:CatB-related O-acetyltransferase [Candidatus Woesearchaeota archaeon]
MKLPLFVSKLVSKVVIYFKYRIHNSKISSNAKIFPFDNVVLGKNVSVGEGAVLSGNLFVGDYTHINRNCDFSGGRSVDVVLGKFCSVASGTSIINSNHYTNRITTYGIKEELGLNCKKKDYYEKGPITIGNDVWIGRDAIILSGVRIGNGAIVAASAVVSKDVDDYEIVGGIPAKHIKYRFSEEVRTLLLSLKWWDWSEKKIRDNSLIFDLDLTNQDDIKKLRDIVNKK